jgi:hypothetical protein
MLIGQPTAVMLGTKKAQQDVFVRGGRFRSGPLFQKVASPITGRQSLEFTAYYNGAWQNDRVLIEHPR